MLPHCENLPHTNTGRGCLAFSLWGPSNYTTKIPLALQCTIIALGLVNQHLPFSFRAIDFYHFAFIGVCCQCTIIPLGLVNQHLPFSFRGIHFYHFAFIGVCCHGFVSYQLFMIVGFDSIVWDLYWNCECPTYQYCAIPRL